MIFLICLLSTLQEPIEALEAEPETSVRASFRSLPRCGHNCLFAYHLAHIGVRPYIWYCDHFDDDPRGVELVKMVEFSNQLGLPSVAEKIAFDQLAEQEFPIIAHLDSRSGHYVLVGAADQKSVAVIDLLTLESSTQSRADFCKLWSGYVLRPLSFSEVFPRWFAGGFLVTLGLLFLASLWKPGVLKTKRAQVVAALFMAFCVTGCSANDGILGSDSFVADNTGVKFHVSPVSIVRQVQPSHAQLIPAQRWQAILRKFALLVPVYDPSTLVHHADNRLLVRGWEDQDKRADAANLINLLLTSKSTDWYRLTTDAFLFYRGVDGRVRMAGRNERGGEGHPAQIICSMASHGFLTSTNVKCGETQTTLQEILQSLLHTAPEAQENEWVVMALARYLMAGQQWTLESDARVSLDDYVVQLLNLPRGDGACLGTHPLQALSTVYVANKLRSIVSPTVAQRIEQHLVETAHRLEVHQSPAGYWSPNWVMDKSDVVSNRSLDVLLSEDRETLIQITGHHFEWFTLLPLEMQPNDLTQQRALIWMVEQLEKATPQEIHASICPYSHCLRAVALYQQHQTASPGRGQ